MRPRVRSALVALGLTAALGGGTAWQIGRIGHVTETDARVMADMVTISSRIDGWVAQRPVTDGQIVHAGEVVAVIDQREAEEKRAELAAHGESIRLERERVTTQRRVAAEASAAAVAAASARGAGAEADLRAAAAEVEHAREEFRRAEALLASQFGSHQAWELRRTQLAHAEENQRAAQARRTEAEAALVEARAHLGDVAVLDKEIERLAQQAAEIDAQRRQADIALADRVVRSPIDAIVDQKFVEPGEYVIPGQRLLLLHDPRAVWVEANVKETKLEHLRPGQSVAVTVDAFPGRVFDGRIERIGSSTTSQFALLPSPNPSGNFTKITQRVPLRIALTQPEDLPLRPGMMVEVDVDATAP